MSAVSLRNFPRVQTSLTAFMVGNIAAAYLSSPKPEPTLMEVQSGKISEYVRTNPGVVAENVAEATAIERSRVLQILKVLADTRVVIRARKGTNMPYRYWVA